MKQPLSLALATLCATMLMMTSCTTKGDSDFVNCSINDYTMPAEASTLTVTVDASGQYEVMPGASWLTVSAQETDSFTLAAGENPDKSPRTTTVTVTCGAAHAQIQIVQLMQETDYRYRRLTVHGAAISPSGRYIVTNTDEIRDGVDGSLLQLIDPYTTEVVATTYIPSYVSGMSTVTDDGLAFGDLGSITSYSFDIRTGDYAIVPVPDSGTPMVSNVSADGTKWAGSVAKGGTYTPTLWTDGVPAYLPLPETDYRGGNITNRILARGISADGNVIYGNTWVGLDMGMLYWKDGQVDWVGKDLRKLLTVTDAQGTEQTLVNGMTCSAEPYNISETGKYIGGTYTQEIDPDTNQAASAVMSCPAFFNTETGTTTLFEEFPGAGGFACRDNGLAVIIPSMSIGHLSTLVNIETKETLGSYQDYILENFGIILPAGSVDLIAGENNDVFFGMEPGILANWWWYSAPKK